MGIVVVILVSIFIMGKSAIEMKATIRKLLIVQGCNVLHFLGNCELCTSYMVLEASPSASFEYLYNLKPNVSNLTGKTKHYKLASDSEGS